MDLFKKTVVLSLVVASSYATSLQELVDATLQNNQNLEALKFQNRSLEKNYQSVQNSYNPSLSVGGSYLQLDGDKRAVQVGQTTVGFVKASIDLYSGGKNSALKKQKKYEYQSGVLAAKNTQKETILQLVTLYFNARTVVENIKVFQEKAKTLKAQYERVKTKYELKMTTEDEVLKLQSEYESNNYTIVELEYQKEELLQNLSLLSGKVVDSLEDVKLPTLQNINYKPTEAIESLKYSLQAQQESVAISAAATKPQVKLEDTYSVYNYDDYNSKVLTDLPDQQNQLLLTINMKLFDTASSHKTEAAQLAALSVSKKLAFAKNQEKINFELAKRKLQTLQKKLSSLKSALASATSVYNAIAIKYENGIVDNVIYLDALSKKVYNEALYKQALNDYEIAKASYYLLSGVDFTEVLKKWEH